MPVQNNISVSRFVATIAAAALSLALHTFNFCLAENQKTKLIVGVEEIDYAPYYQTVDGDYQGFAADVFREFALQHGYAIEFKPMPIKRLYAALFQGHIHFKFPDHPYWNSDNKSEHKIQYSEPLAGFTDGVLVVESRKDIKLGSLKTLGFVRGFTAWPYLDAINKQSLKARELNSLKSLLLLTLDKRIDGAYFNVKVAQHLLANNIHTSDNTNTENLVLAENLPFDRNNYLASSARSDAPLEEFNSFLISRAFNALLTKYELSINPKE